jgi:NAD+ synthase (glutamine-hydrolysing)
MKIALGQINTSMGAAAANLAKMDRVLKEAHANHADLTVFPELAVNGYPPKDLLEYSGFIREENEALQKLAAAHSDKQWIVGFVELGGDTGKGRYNSAAYFSKGKLAFVQRKRLLPTYDVFDENRYFDADTESRIVTISGKRIGITICEDIWTEPEFLGRKLYNQDPVGDLKKKGADLILNISASPYHSGKQEIRRKLTERIIQTYGLPLAYVNLVGGNDELLFDGGSFALDAKGKTIARGYTFQEDLVFCDFGKGEGTLRSWPEEPEQWELDALVMGLKDYVYKCGFKKAVLGLSGGIDSALVLLLAVEALGAKNVMAVSMPSRYTSDMSRQDAEVMANKLGVTFLTIPIEPVIVGYDAALKDVFQDLPKDKTEENIQARTRGNILMAISNKMGHMVLSTGNKSELAVGYCTQYGDMAGGLAVISDVPKHSVYRLTRQLNRKYEAVPQRVFERPPTAELKPNQRDEDTLPPYDTLDQILHLYVEERFSHQEIVAKGFQKEIVERVLQMVDQNEFKRRQAAPGLRLSQKAFGVGRRMPIARGAV